MLTINEEALEVAQELLAAGAGEEGENNSGPWVEKFLAGIAEPPCNWCMAMQSYCFKEAAKRLGIKMPFPYSLGARKTFNYFNTKGWIILDAKKAWPGDLVFFWRVDTNSWEGHVGISETAWKDGNMVILQTIEGNRSYFPSKVKQYQYSRSLNAEAPNYYNIPRFLGLGRIPNA